MLTFVGNLFALIMIAAHAAPPYADQSLHERILFGENAKGGYVMSFYNRDTGVVRFSSCLAAVCETLAGRDFQLRELNSLQHDMLRELIKLRGEYFEYLRSHPVQRFFLGAQNIGALDRLEEEIREDGTSKWILFRQRAQGRVAPAFASTNLFSQVSAILNQVLKKSKPADQQQLEMALDIGVNRSHR